MAMKKAFKPITMDDLKLSPEDMTKIAVGAALFMQLPEEDGDEETGGVEPLVTPRPNRGTV